MRNSLKAACTAAALFVSVPAFAGWEPTKPVEIVVAAGAGGASDQMARMMQAAIPAPPPVQAPAIAAMTGTRHCSSVPSTRSIRAS